MQLTILLYLMQRRGDSVPTGRTELYTSYMQTFLDREATKSPAVHRHRRDLEEVTAFLGWHLQSLAEANGANGQLATRAIKSAINTHLYEVDRDTTLVDDLFTAVTDRVWALTSKVQGTFEFDVQPVREYFAARYLWEFAGSDSKDLPRSTLLRHLIRRPHWLNTSRFYAGFANPNEITGLVEGLEDELDQRCHPRQVRIAAWSLLTDSVFIARPRTQRRAAAMFADDLSVRLINHALDSGDDIVPLASDQGALALAETLQQHVGADPASPLTTERMHLAARLVPDKAPLYDWWRPQMAAATDTPHEEAWLRAGIPFHGGRQLQPSQVDALALTSPTAAQTALDAGVVAPAGSSVEDRMVRAVLGGLCSDATPSSTSLPGDLVRLLAPQHFLRMASSDERAFAVATGHADTRLADHHRQSVLRRLTGRYERFGRIQKALRFGKGQAGTTSPWGNTAREIAAIFGPCWLAADIAVIGAASPDGAFRTGGDLTKDSAPLGADADFGRLLQDARRYRSTARWWLELFGAFDDSLSRGTWALALLAVASHDTVAACLKALDEAVCSLPTTSRHALLLSSSRIGASGLARRLPISLVAAAGSLSATTALLIAHHAAERHRVVDLPALTDAQLAATATHGVAGWPASRAVTARIGSGSTADLLDSLKACGAAATVDMDTRAKAVPIDLVRAIVDQPAHYPLAWLLAAEQRISQHYTEPPVADVAEQDRWFDQP